MKTAVSLPDDLFTRAERTARRLGRTRSRLYAEALEAYLAGLDDRADQVTAALDRVYAEDEAPTTGAAIGRRLIDDGSWQW
jgi:predicted DNA-binding protein